MYRVMICVSENGEDRWFIHYASRKKSEAKIIQECLEDEGMDPDDIRIDYQPD